MVVLTVEYARGPESRDFEGLVEVKIERPPEL